MIVFAKSSFLDVRLGSEYASEGCKNVNKFAYVRNASLLKLISTIYHFNVCFSNITT